MERYLSIKAQTALYISIFFISLHHVFVYLTNSSILKYTFGLKTGEVLSIYGIASLFGICVFLLLLNSNPIKNIKRNIYISASIEIFLLISMYYFSLYQNVYVFVGLFLVHHMMTPYILFNLDTLFETYTHIKDRGKGRGIYLTVWNIPFVVIPLIMSTLTVSELPIVYIISSILLLPFLYLIFIYIQNPDYSNEKDTNTVTVHVSTLLGNFFKDKLDRNSFMVQSSLHLYYGMIAVILPIYLHSVFGFDWDKIGLILAVMTTPFILIQIPFGNMEDKRHNEKTIFKIGIFIILLFTLLVLTIKPEMTPEISILLFMLFLFLTQVGCSLIEISTESMFYKHVTERDSTALLIFRAARILPYSLGALAILFI